MTSARAAPRATARVWWTISSSVTGSVVSWPRTTMPSESPTSSASTPAPVEQPRHGGVVRGEHGDLLAALLLLAEIRTAVTRWLRVIDVSAFVDRGGSVLASQPVTVVVTSLLMFRSVSVGVFADLAGEGRQQSDD